MTHAQYTDNVIGAGSPRYDNAYFQINYVRVYALDAIASSVSSSLQHTSTATGGTSNPTSTNSGRGSNTGVVSNVSPLYLFVLLFVGALAVFI